VTTKPEPKKTKGMCIATRCTSVEQFIQMFHRFVDEESFFVSTLNTREPGLETSFSVQLIDGTPVLRGMCVVMQAWTDTSNPFKTPGVRLGIKRLTANSMVVFEQLLVTRSAAKGLPRPPTGTGTPKVITPIATRPLGSAAPQPVTPVTTKPMAGATKLKPPASIVVGVPKTIGVPNIVPKSPFTETAPTKQSASRLELSQPARVSEPVPLAVHAETTDVIEETTDVREPKLPPGFADPPKVSGAPTSADADLAIPFAQAQAETKPSSDAPRGLPLPADDLRQAVEAELDLAKPSDDDGRTPGSDLVLPANPLMNLSDESLEGYVDCTLYEETGNFFPADDEAADFVDDVVPPPALTPPVVADRVLIEPRKRTITPLPAAPDALAAAEAKQAVSPISAAYETVRESSPSILVPPQMPGPAMPRDSIMVDPALVARGSTPAFEPEHKAKVETPTFTADGATKPTFDAEALPLPALDTSSSRLAATPHKRSRGWLLGGLAGVVAAIAIVVVVMTMSSSNGDSAPSTKPVKQVAPMIDAKPDPATDVTAAADDRDEPSPGDGPPLVGEGPCTVVVKSTPAGSLIAIDGKTVGPSPLTIATTCEQHKVDIAHARYQATSKLVTLAEGSAQNVDVTLQRPTHTVTVTSHPSGATIYIDGRSAGTTPTKLNVLGFVTIKLELKKTGYQPASTKLYSRYPQDTVAVRLTKW
jgi:hypothetical protein